MKKKEAETEDGAMNKCKVSSKINLKLNIINHNNLK